MTICDDPPTRVFGGGEVGVDAKGDGKGPPAKLFGESPHEKSCFGGGDAGVDNEGVGEAPRAKVLEKAMPM